MQRCAPAASRTHQRYGDRMVPSIYIIGSFFPHQHYLALGATLNFTIQPHLSGTVTHFQSLNSIRPRAVLSYFLGNKWYVIYFVFDWRFKFRRRRLFSISYSNKQKANSLSIQHLKAILTSAFLLRSKICRKLIDVA